MKGRKIKQLEIGNIEKYEILGKIGKTLKDKSKRNKEKENSVYLEIGKIGN